MRLLSTVLLLVLCMSSCACASQKFIQTAGRDNLGNLAPDFARYNDDILFGEVWSRNDELSLHDRSLITISALMGAGILDSSFQAHLSLGKKHGITKQEITEVITQLAFYTGWPKAWAAFGMARQVWNDDNKEDSQMDDKAQYQNTIFFPIGEPNTAFAKYFTGQSYLAPISTAQVPMFNVTFEPGCRNNWHIHHAKTGGGQMLICVGGRGYYQAWGEEPVEMTPGTVVNIPAGVKHWHGAAKDSWFSHIAVEVPGTETSNEWLEPVTDDEYLKLK